MTTENTADTTLDTTGAENDAAANKIVSTPGNENVSPEAKAAAAAAAKAEQERQAAAAAAAAEAAKKAEQDKAQGAEVRYEYNPTGDPGLDVALAFIGNLGFSAENEAVQAATRGDFGPIKAAMEVLGSKAAGHEKYLALAQAAFEARTKAKKEQTERDEQAVYQAVGGKEAWDAIAAFTKANADEGEKKAIQAALAAGGLQAQSMALLLQRAYRKANPTTPNLAKAEASGAGGGGAKKMTTAEYAAAVRKIAANTRGPIDNNPEYLALRKQFATQ